MRSVLVTGASRGIGRATAERLAAAGWQVFAGVRRADDAPAGTTAVVVDVTDAAQVAALPDVLPARLEAVVNNAGVVVAGPVEALSAEDLRRQLDINVVGQVAVTKAVLPKLRTARGRIVFVSSVSGRISTPMTGAYTASKFALEAIADALRVELRPWGIAVSLIEPGAIDTDMWQTAPEMIEETNAGMAPEYRRLYAGHVDGMRKTVRFIQKQASPPRTVVAAIEKALMAQRPKARYVVGADAKAQLAAKALLPTRGFDAIIAQGTGTPRRRRS